ncbi:uncharacterized protein RCO7_10337 [Rhynchosporium graminicola]|uniref:Uncharacterized protein n=1 Tax=Rhynchosporium graminicola TaxID=2792576 RepID=A0A1E1K871_9HELO|nr:uncharacterized protein RCO7_10337 [Rhynchosporium commune]
MPHWQGRELALYLLLTGAGELVSTLEAEIYSKDLPVSKGLPGVVDIVLHLLNSRISQEQIRRTLGRAYSYSKDNDSILSNVPQLDVSFGCTASSNADLDRQSESLRIANYDIEPGYLRPTLVD